MNTNFTNGYVVLPVEEYNKLKEVIEAQQRTLDELVTIERSFNGEQINVTLNAETVHSLAICKFEEDADLVNNYTLKEASSFVAWGSTLATLKSIDELINDMED